MGMVFFSSGKAVWSFGRLLVSMIFLLPPTRSVGFCLLPVYLGKGAAEKKESLNVEMTSYAAEAVNSKGIG